MAKDLEQKLEAESFQHPSASCMASQVPCEPKSPLSKQMWRPKQKALHEASGVATSQACLSQKGKMPACFVKTVSREVTTTMPSPNSGAVTPSASLVLMS